MRLVPATLFVFFVCTVSVLTAQDLLPKAGLIEAAPAPPLTIEPGAYAPTPTAFPSVAGSKEQEKVNKLQTKLQSDEISEEEKKKTTADLEKAVAALFDLEVKLTKERIAKMQKGIEKRVADRDKLIKKRVAKLVNAPKPGDTTFRIGQVKEQPDGDSIAIVTLLRVEQRTRTIPIMEMKAEQRVRTVDGKEQAYTVNVPVQRTVEQTYTVQIPAGRKEVTIPKGKDVNETVKKFIDSMGDF